jgi:uncharacterized protein YabE (DUF348 family)
LVSVLLTGCQSKTPIQINIIDKDQLQIITTNEVVPLLILTSAGIALQPDDVILVDGFSASLDQPINKEYPVTIQIHKATDLTLNGLDGSKTIRTNAFTFGEALSDQGLFLFASDLFDPVPEKEVDGPLTVAYIPARELNVFVDGQFTRIRSSAQTVGGVLADVGITLTGLDYSSPSPDESLPEDGQIRIVRVTESILLNQKSIPYNTQYQDSAELEWGQQEILQPGQNGLAITKTRVLYEDGAEMSRDVEEETIIRPPQDRIAERGTNIVLKTTSVDGVAIQYWHALQMYATSYSPCRSGVTGQCFNGTAGGYPLHKGVVAMYKEWFNVLRGSEVYVPGYGRAVIGDLGGGFPDDRPWIDLGYSDNDWQTWSGYVTVYFLGPAPASIPYFMQ